MSIRGGEGMRMTIDPAGLENGLVPNRPDIARAGKRALAR